MIGVRKLSESGFIKGQYTGRTDLKLDSLSHQTSEPFGVLQNTPVWDKGKREIYEHSITSYSESLKEQQVIATDCLPFVLFDKFVYVFFCYSLELKHRIFYKSN